MNCSEEEIQQLLPDPDDSCVLYVQFANPGKKFGFVYKCLISRLLERWELEKEQLWDNFAMLTLPRSIIRYCILPQSNLKRVKCICPATFTSIPLTFRRALLTVTESLLSEFPQFQPEVLLQSGEGLIAPDMDVLLAVESGEPAVLLRTKEGTRSHATWKYNQFFFRGYETNDAYCVYASATYNIANLLQEELSDRKVQN